MAKLKDKPGTAALEGAPAERILEWALETYGDRVAIATSFQHEGMVLVDMGARISAALRVFTLDTGRLPEETYEMIETVRSRYGVRVELVAPDPGEVDSMVSLHGPNLFYRAVPARMLCCQIRKVRPLERKLAQLDAWITGLRRTQAGSRAGIRTIERSADKTKISPLAGWTRAQVEEYITRHQVPAHPLYGRGYGSIGCEPCTRAVAAGEPVRAGRWWWEQDADKECGIHFSPDGKAERQVDVLLREVLAARHE